jgi:3'(2'), 5'-bisphosphate nucleotidase
VNFQREQQIAVAAVREAAALCQAVQAQITPQTLEKKDKSPVTVADFGSQALVCRAIHEAFPHDPIVAEEDAAELRQEANAALCARVVQHVQACRPHPSASEVLEWIDYGGAREYRDRFWTLDPIDGTKGFLRKEQYALALALIVEGEVAVAALGCPNLPLEPDGSSVGAVFTAVRGGGARVLPLAGEGHSQTIGVSACRQAANARFCQSVESGHSKHDDAARIAQRLEITSPPARLDSQAKYAVVARGEAEIYLRLPTSAEYREKIWDHAAGMLVVTEAGGQVTDISGKPLNFRLGSELRENRGVIVTNGLLHAEVLEAIKELGIGA